VGSYEAFARFYDAVQGDRAEALPFVRPHLGGAKTVLELACGTGSILVQLRGEYEVVGVDLSPRMLEIASEKLPGVELVQGDMTEVRLGRTFDAVLCLYDSINHLLRFDEWLALFDTACAHLAPGGVFVFDMNSQERLDWFVGRPAVALDFGEADVVVIDVVDGGDDVRNWELRVFEHVGGDEYRLAEEVIPEVSFPAERVRAALAERFGQVDDHDEAGRLWFVCTDPVAAA
jgi:SAM-dependent methyltransferase